jgi:hypothetical protein
MRKMAKGNWMNCISKEGKVRDTGGRRGQGDGYEREEEKDVRGRMEGKDTQ